MDMLLKPSDHILRTQAQGHLIEGPIGIVGNFCSTAEVPQRTSTYIHLSQEAGNAETALLIGLEFG